MFSVSSDLLSDLALIATLPSSILQEFLAISIESLRTGLPSKNKLVKVSEKLASATAENGAAPAAAAPLEWTDISNLLLALIQYLLDATKMDASQEEFIKAVEEIQLKDEHKQILQQVSRQEGHSLRHCSSWGNDKTDHFRCLTISLSFLCHCLTSYVLIILSSALLYTLHSLWLCY